MTFRSGTKMAQAVDIFNEVDGNRAAFLQAAEEVFASKSTRATYFNLVFMELQTTQEEITALVRDLTRKTQLDAYSSVKVKRGSHIASHVQLFMSLDDATAYNEHNRTFTDIIPGEQEIGAEVGTTVVI